MRKSGYAVVHAERAVGFSLTKSRTFNLLDNHPSIPLQYFHNVPAVALRGSLRSGADPGFGARLRSLEDTHQKTCDTDVGEWLFC